ncbi:hypothetical protein KAU11_08580 [Candidatus Babeliales bacterium]|nr:hypothetical protein [Candidatus Babeliales bacterium]
MNDFLNYWSAIDLNKAFAINNCYDSEVLMWYKHLDLGYIVYVTPDDIGMSLGDSLYKVTPEICGEQTHIKISDVGESVLLMAQL